MGLEVDSPLLMPAETIDGVVSSYISVQALQLLKQIAARITFVPVTTRTMQQYKRIQLFTEHVRPAYAITSNGGNILHHGVPDSEWNRHVLAGLAQYSADASDIMALFGQIRNDEWVTGERYCDELFYSIVINRERMPVDEVEDLGQEIRKLGWEMSVQGRKICMVPLSVSKEAAMTHLQQRLGREVIAASGDSLLDRGLLEMASHGIVPRHGELYREELRNAGSVPFTFTQASGILAADEIVTIVYSLCHDRQPAQA